MPDNHVCRSSSCPYVLINGEIVNYRYDAEKKDHGEVIFETQQIDSAIFFCVGQNFESP